MHACACKLLSRVATIDDNLNTMIIYCIGGNFHESFKTGFLHLFVYETTPCKLHGSYQNYNKVLRLFIPQSLMMHEDSISLKFHDP